MNPEDIIAVLSARAVLAESISKGLEEREWNSLHSKNSKDTSTRSSHTAPVPSTVTIFPSSATMIKHKKTSKTKSKDNEHRQLNVSDQEFEDICTNFIAMSSSPTCVAKGFMDEDDCDVDKKRRKEKSSKSLSSEKQLKLMRRKFLAQSFQIYDSDDDGDSIAIAEIASDKYTTSSIERNFSLPSSSSHKQVSSFNHSMMNKWSKSNYEPVRKSRSKTRKSKDGQFF